MGTVYLLNAWGTDNYKIGVTKRDIDKRIKQLQTGCPDEIVLVKKFECEHYRKVESWLHRQHGSKRVEGEWFILEDSDIQNFEVDCERIHTTVKLLIEDNPFFN